MFKLCIFDKISQYLKESTQIVNKMLSNVNNVFQPKNNLVNSSDKQGICLKMYKMAILEALIFKNFWRSIPTHPLETRAFGARCGSRSSKHIRPAFGVLKLGVYDSIDLNIWSISTLDTVDFEENNKILLRKATFAFLIPSPSLDFSYVVLNFWPNLRLAVLIKLFL